MNARLQTSRSNSSRAANSSAPAEVFISYAHEDERLRQQLETHLKLLQREGLISAWHDRQIVAGTEWAGQIDAHLNSARVILLLISADFLASDYCYDVEMRRAMQRHDAGEARVIPVILRPVDNWEAAPFGRLQALPTDGKPITEWRPRDRAFAEVAHGIRIAIENLSHTRPHPPPKNNRQRMLTRVRSAWIEGFLEDSLHGAALQALGLEERPDAVPDPWGMVVQQTDREARTLAPDTSIVQVFDDADVDGELLILGEPGSGKTTLLLELTRTLLDRAEQYESLPIPVVLPLSTWAVKRLPLADWLVDELNQRYDVALQIGQEWVANDQILPLLDGLDEVAAEHGAACVAAINAYGESRAKVLSSLVVTSRVTEYEALTIHLKLRGAVLLQAFRPEQIDAYVASAGEQLAGVRAALQADATLQQLAASPLLLSAMTLAYQGAPAEVLPTKGTVEERRSHVFATYIEQMFQRRGAAASYSRQQTLHWLGWLATALNQQAQTVFYIDRMQPDWLATRQLRRWYTFVDRVGGLVVGLIAGLLVGLLYGHAFEPLDGLTGGLFYGLFLGLVGALFGGTGSSLLMHRRRVPPVLRGGALGGFVGGLAGGLVLGLIEAMNRGRGYDPTRTLLANLIDWVLFAESGGVGYVLLGVLVGGLVGALTGGPAIRPRRVMVVETLRLSGGVLSPGIVGLAVGLVVGLVIVVVGRVIDDATPLGDPVIALRMVLVVGVGFGLVFGLLGGLVAGEVEAKSRPNQGIRRSARMAIRVGVGAGLASWLLGALVIAQIHSLGPWQATALAVALAIGLPLGLMFGGYACLSHYALRAVLWRAGALPLDTVRFLDYATERIFLRRVGGGYIFVHRLLQEYFAEQASTASPAGPAQAKTSTPIAAPAPTLPIERAS